MKKAVGWIFAIIGLVFMFFLPIIQCISFAVLIVIEKDYSVISLSYLALCLFHAAMETSYYILGFKKVLNKRTIKRIIRLIISGIIFFGIEVMIISQHESCIVSFITSAIIWRSLYFLFWIYIETSMLKDKLDLTSNIWLSYSSRVSKIPVKDNKIYLSDETLLYNNLLNQNLSQSNKTRKEKHAQDTCKRDD